LASRAALVGAHFLKTVEDAAHAAAQKELPAAPRMPAQLIALRPASLSLEEVAA
jgi:hypothetical protein